MRVAKRVVLMVVSLMVTGVMAGEAVAGGVGFSRNRLVYPASSHAINITVTNAGDSVYLVQAGVSGQPDKKTPAPFVVTPPLFRLNPNSSNEVRIVGAGAGAGLPQDRESVFYFSGVVIPGQGAGASPVASGETGATLSIAMRSVLKLFWRPDGLKMMPGDAPGKMQFTRVTGGVLVKNPTPYYQSFGRLRFDGKEQDLSRGPSMVAPFSELKFPVSGSVSQVTWQVMNDYGGATEEVTSTLQSVPAK